MSPKIREGSCQVTKASPGRGNVMSKGLELSCVRILYDARIGDEANKEAGEEDRIMVV